MIDLQERKKNLAALHRRGHLEQTIASADCPFMAGLPQEGNRSVAPKKSSR